MVYVIFVVTNDVQELFMIDNEDKILASIPKHNFFFRSSLLLLLFYC